MHTSFPIKIDITPAPINGIIGMTDNVKDNSFFNCIAYESLLKTAKDLVLPPFATTNFYSNKPKLLKSQ